MTASNNPLGTGKDSLLENAALLIIDMQMAGYDIVPTVPGIIPTAKGILDAWRQTSMPVIFKVREHRADGIDVERFRIPLFQKKPFMVTGTPDVEIFPELKPNPDEFLVKGTRFSAFFQTDMQIVLTRLGIKTLVVCGIQTPNCIRTSVTDALAYDYNVVLVNDAITAQTPAIHEANMLDMRNMGAISVESQELLASLQG